jgi:hypothetical protein
MMLLMIRNSVDYDDYPAEEELSQLMMLNMAVRLEDLLVHLEFSNIVFVHDV